MALRVSSEHNIFASFDAITPLLLNIFILLDTLKSHWNPLHSFNSLVLYKLRRKIIFLPKLVNSFAVAAQTHSVIQIIQC